MIACFCRARTMQDILTYVQQEEISVKALFGMGYCGDVCGTCEKYIEESIEKEVQYGVRR